MWKKTKEIIFFSEYKKPEDFPVNQKIFFHTSSRQLQDHPILEPIASTRQPKHHIPSIFILILPSYFFLSHLQLNHILYNGGYNQVGPYHFLQHPQENPQAQGSGRIS